MDWNRFSLEQELLIHCTSARPGERARLRIRDLAQQELDDDYLLRHARRHGLMPLLYTHLKNVSGTRRPMQEISRYAQRIVMRNLQYTKELVAVCKAFEEAEIPVIPFKGPILAHLAYGNPGVREYQDMDMLVPLRHHRKAKTLLLELGYKPGFDLTPQQEQERIDAQIGYELYRDEHRLRILVELHWSFLNTCHNFELDPASVFSRAEAANVGGQRVLNMAPEDLLIYLSAHATKHLWERLNWTGDIAALVSSRSDLDWEMAFDRARRLGSVRMVSLGLYLASELLDVALPPSVREQVYADSTIPRLVDDLVEGWLFREPDAPDLEERKIFWFLVRTRERWVDNLPYLRHSTGLLVRPSKKDREFVELPDSLAPLYYLVRPFRILKQQIF